MNMQTVKPPKTLADYLVISISPVLIMLLVGSLSFFLIEVFFRGEAIGSVRWVMFWFVMAVVLVSRIGIEGGPGQAAVYGIALAVATWLYLVRIHPAFILGALLLALVWWCAHKLTWDCTLIDEDEDASGGGLLQTASNRKNFLPFRKKSAKTAAPKTKREKPVVQPHSPGLWVVWFSLAALPLFGIGQMLLPGGASDARQAGFFWLFVYVTAALGLLLTTSFLGLRRYLRQRYLPMPGAIAFGWIRFGVGVAVLVLIGALLLPRPGATAARQSLGYHINYQLHQASDYAAKFGPHGSGAGKVGDELDKSAPQKNATDPSGAEKSPGQSPEPQPGKSDQSQPSPPPGPPSNANHIFQWLRALFILAVVALIGWFVFRHRALLLSMFQAFLAALKNFLNDLFRWGSRKDGAATGSSDLKPKPKRRLFAAYRNPFLTGQDSSWTPEQLVIYSYEALQAWAEEKGIEPHPEQTAREFCRELAGRFPEITDELNQMSRLYGHAAYGTARLPAGDLEPIKNVWRFLGG
jgi:type II secretory pathway pseudopilin PulG